MKKTFYYTVLVCLATATLFVSCKKTGVKPDNGGTTANTIRGTIYDAHQNKFNIPGASVIVHALGNIGSIGDDNAMYNVTMDAASRYSATVKSGLYIFHARAYMPLNGKIVCIDLAPSDGKYPGATQASAPGIVKDFKLQLTGCAPWGDANNYGDYYGAHINFSDGKFNFTSEGYWDNLATAHPGAKVIFTLSIKSPLIDGSTGQSQRVECGVDALKTGQWFVDIPYAAYRVTAKLVEASGIEKPLKLSNSSDIQTHSDYLDLLFPPDPDDADGRPVEPTMVVWEN